MDLETFKREWFGPEDYVTAHTSGSTGLPKEIRLLKSDMRVSARATNLRFGINKNSLLFLPLSLDYIAGKMMAVRAFEAGCRLIVVSPSNQFDMPEGIAQGREASMLHVDGSVDLLAIVPSQVDWLIKHPEWVGLFKNIIIGGAPLDSERRRAICKWGYNAYCTYGMTETCSHVALQPVNCQDEGRYEAMPCISFEKDERGCLRIVSPNFSWKILATNDMVDLISPTAFRWLGRIDNVINSGGIKLQAETIEDKIRPLLALPFYIRPCPHEKWGQVPELVINYVLSEEEQDAFAQSLMETLRQNLDRIMLPQKITFRNSFEYTSSGKIKRI